MTERGQPCYISNSPLLLLKQHKNTDASCVICAAHLPLTDGMTYLKWHCHYQRPESCFCQFVTLVKKKTDYQPSTPPHSLEVFLCTSGLASKDRLSSRFPPQLQDSTSRALSYIVKMLNAYQACTYVCILHTRRASAGRDSPYQFHFFNLLESIQIHSDLSDHSECTSSSKPTSHSMLSWKRFLYLMTNFSHFLPLPAGLWLSQLHPLTHLLSS